MERCTDVLQLLDIEGYAYIGMVEEARVYKCGKRKSIIVVELRDGKTLCTPCLEDDVVRISIRVIELYTKAVKLVSV